MYPLTYDAARTVLRDPTIPDAYHVLAHRDHWAEQIANRAIADPNDLQSRFAFLVGVDPAVVIAADRAIFAAGDHGDAAFCYVLYTDYVVWEIVRADARAMLDDVDQVAALLGGDR